MIVDDMTKKNVQIMKPAKCYFPNSKFFSFFQRGDNPCISIKINYRNVYLQIIFNFNGDIVFEAKYLALLFAKPQFSSF